VPGKRLVEGRPTLGFIIELPILENHIEFVHFFILVIVFVESTVWLGEGDGYIGSRTWFGESDGVSGWVLSTIKIY
jgi:hypothetical protein